MIIKTKESAIEVLGHAMDDVNAVMEFLEESHKSSVAKKADTIVGKIYNLIYDVASK